MGHRPINTLRISSVSGTLGTTHLGVHVSNYRDVQSAVRVEKFRIWFAWFSGGFIMLGITIATKDSAVVSVVTQVLLVGLGVFFTTAAVKMTNRLNRKADAARREVLGEDM
ncbi:hypothetical protein ABT039_22255 [Streptomyces lasiicapitis]|uniref:hypothetical protein n=1 Tax=Streptomyces lasiicapitis TaxID=1923961 RepID=UPI00331F4E77